MDTTDYEDWSQSAMVCYVYMVYITCVIHPRIATRCHKKGCGRGFVSTPWVPRRHPPARFVFFSTLQPKQLCSTNTRSSTQCDTGLRLAPAPPSAYSSPPRRWICRGSAVDLRPRDLPSASASASSPQDEICRHHDAAVGSALLRGILRQERR